MYACFFNGKFEKANFVFSIFLIFQMLFTREYWIKCIISDSNSYFLHVEQYSLVQELQIALEIMLLR